MDGWVLGRAQRAKIFHFQEKIESSQKCLLNNVSSKNLKNTEASFLIQKAPEINRHIHLDSITVLGLHSLQFYHG